MKIIIIYLLALSALYFSACKPAALLPVTAPATPGQYRNTIADSTTIASIPWKTFFSNEQLQQLIDCALVNNLDLQLAVKNINAAQQLLQQSKLGYLPDVKLQASGAINRPSDNSLNGISLSQFLGKSYVEDYTLSAGISWEADIWNKIKNQQTKALAAYLQTAEARKAIQTNLIANIANGYYNLLMLDEQVSIAQKNLLLSDSTLRIIRLQYDAGEVTALAVEQATAQQQVAAQLIPQLQQAIGLQENALSILTGATPAAIQRKGSITAPVYAGSPAAGFPSALLQNRPDVKQKELAVSIASANTGIAKANMYPTLAITATGGINSFKASNWFNIPASLFATATGAITQPLFMRKQLRTQYELSKIEREKAVIEFRQSVLNAVGEVSDALVSINKIKEQATIAQARVNTLQQAIANANLLFKNGMANYLEVITAQSNLLAGELNLAVLQKQQSAALISLYRSLGGGGQ